MFQKDQKIILGLAAFLVVLLTHPLQAQTLTGQVFNKETSRPIPYASIYLTELSTGTLADSAGFFSISNFPSSPTTLKISAIGFGTFTTIITYNSKEVYTFYLEPKHVHLDEVVVSTPFGKLQNENVTNVQSIRLNEINRIPVSNLSEALANIPGVYQASYGTGIGKPVIRGMSGVRVVTYVNGIRIENQQWGDDHGIGITEVGIEGVEIIKGPASLLYGSDALGGVLYFVNQSYARLNNFEGYFSSGVESNSLGTSNQLGLKWNKNGLKINLFLGQSLNADFMLPNGYRLRNSRYNSATGKLSIGYNKKNWVGNLHYSIFNSFIGVPGDSHADSVYASLFYSDDVGWSRLFPHQHVTNNLVSFENKFFFERSQLEIILGHTLSGQTEYEEKVTIPAIDLRLNSSLLNVRWKIDLTEKLKVVTGVQGMIQMNRNGSKAEEVLIPDNNTQDAGIYAVINYDLKRLSFQAGARYDFRSIETFEAFKGFEIIQHNYESYNYSGGFSYRVDSLIFRVNISTGFRAPHTSELLSNGIHHGTYRYQVGDPDLKTENATQFDFSLNVNYDHLELVFNPFFNQISNYIYLNPADTLIDGFQVYNYSQVEKAQLFGGDFSLHLHPHFAHWLHLQSSFSYIYAQDENAQALPLIPANRINSQLKIDFGGKRKFSVSDFVLQHHFFFDQNRVSSFESATASYHLLHAALHFKYESKGQPVYITLGVKNILNTAYVDHLSRLKQIGLEMPGINFYLGIKLEFEKAINKK